MKVSSKFLGLLSVALGTGLFMSSLSYARFGNPSLGTTDLQRSAVYEDVYNADNVAHEAGDVVVWYSTVTYGLEISSTIVANNSLVAGVVAFGTTCAAASQCKIQIAGYHPAVTVGTVSAGNALVTGTTGEQGEAYTYVQSTGSISTQAVNYGVYGVALSADVGGVAPAFLFR